jgi:MFS family permease
MTFKNIKTLLTNTYGGLTREVWLLAAVMLINRIGTMVVPFMSLYLTEKLGYTIADAGFVMVFWGVGSIFGAYFGGRFTDRYGFANVQFWSLCIGGLMFFVVSQLQTYHWLCAGVFVLSMFGEAYRPANTASIAHFSTAETFTRSVSLVRLAINLGWSFGPMLGGFFAMYNYTLLFGADGFSNLVAAVIVWFFLKKSTSNPASKIKDTAIIDPKDSAYHDTFFLVFMLFVTFYAIAFFQLFTIAPIFYKNICAFTEIQIGVLMGVNGLLVALVEMMIIYKIEGRWSKIKFIALGVFFVVLNYGIFLTSRSYIFMLFGVILATISEIFTMPFMNVITMERAKTHNRGQYSALYTMSWSIAQVSAPLLGTQTIATLGYDALWYILGGLSAVACMGFWWLGRQ